MAEKASPSPSSESKQIPESQNTPLPGNAERIRLSDADIKKLEGLKKQDQSTINALVTTLQERDIVINPTPVNGQTQYHIIPTNLTGRLQGFNDAQRKQVADRINVVFAQMYTMNDKEATVEQKQEHIHRINEMFQIAFIHALKNSTGEGKTSEFPKQKGGVQSPKDFMTALSSISHPNRATAKLIENIQSSQIENTFDLDPTQLTDKQKFQQKAFLSLAESFGASLNVPKETGNAIHDLNTELMREGTPLFGGMGDYLTAGSDSFAAVSPAYRGITDKINDMMTSSPNPSNVLGFLKVVGGVFLLLTGANWGLGKNNGPVKRLFGALSGYMGFQFLATDELKDWIGGMKSDVRAAKQIMGEKEHKELMDALPSDLEVQAVSILSRKKVTDIQDKMIVNVEKRTVEAPKKWEEYAGLLNAEEISVLEGKFGMSAESFGKYVEDMYYNIGALHNPRVTAVHAKELLDSKPSSCAYLGYLYIQDRYIKNKEETNSILGLTGEPTLSDLMVHDVFAERTSQSKVHALDTKLGMIIKEVTPPQPGPKRPPEAQSNMQPGVDLNRVAPAPTTPGNAVTPEPNPAPTPEPTPSETPLKEGAMPEPIVEPPVAPTSTPETSKEQVLLTDKFKPLTVEERHALFEKIQPAAAIAGIADVQEYMNGEIGKLKTHLVENDIASAKQLLKQFEDMTRYAAAMKIQIDLPRLKATIVDELKKYQAEIPDFHARVNAMLK